MHLERGGLHPEYLLRFVQVARERGVAEIGFTEHAYNFREGAPLLDRPDYVAQRSRGYRIDDYVALIQAAKDEGLPVKLGIEVDFIPERARELGEFLAAYPWDFVIGAVHWIGDWPIDIDPASWTGRDVSDAYRQYFDLAEQAIRSGLFDVFAHPDLVKIFGHRLPGDHDARFAEYAERIAQAAAASGVCLELSSAGLRKPVGEIYPHPTLVAKARAWRVPITLASDAHEPEHVGWAFDRLVDLARSVGYRTLTIFANRQRRQQLLG